MSEESLKDEARALRAAVEELIRTVSHELHIDTLCEKIRRRGTE